MYAFVDLVGSWSWAPICWLLVSHQLPPWIFCNRIYDHYFYLHITVTLNKWAIGVMSIVMNIMLTNLFCIAQHPKERFCNGWQWPLILLPPRLSTYLYEKYLLAMYEYIMVIPTRLHCAGKAREIKKSTNWDPISWDGRSYWSWSHGHTSAESWRTTPKQPLHVISTNRVIDQCPLISLELCECTYQ